MADNQEATNKRTRMNISSTTKGVVTFEVTAEYDTPETTAEALRKGIDLVKQTILDKGLVLANG